MLIISNNKTVKLWRLLLNVKVKNKFDNTMSQMNCTLLTSLGFLAKKCDQLVAFGVTPIPLFSVRN